MIIIFLCLIVISIVASVSVFISLIDGFLSSTMDTGILGVSIEIFVSILVGTIEGIIQAILWVTFVFAILERSGASHGQISLTNKKWTIEDLPTTPVNSKRKISRIETAFGMFFTVIFTSLLYFPPQFIGIYEGNNSGLNLIATLFDSQQLSSCKRTILPIFSITFCILIWKFVVESWSIPLAIMNTILNILLCIPIFTMIHDHSLLNQNFMSNLARLTQIPLSEITNGLGIGILIFTVSFIAISAWDCVDGFLKCRK